MISGDRSLAQGKKGAFYNTLEEFHKYWERIDIICPKARGPVGSPPNPFGNVFIYSSPWSLIRQPWWILKKGREIYQEQKFNLVTVHEYPPFYNGIGARWLWNKIHVPYVLEIFHIVGHPKAASFKESFYKRLSRIFLKFDSSKAMAVRVMNQKQVPDFLLRAGVPKEKIVYIPAIYIDLDIFRPMSLEKKYDLIFIGRLEKNKGPDLLIDAIELLTKNYKLETIKLLIVGEGLERKSSELKTKNYKLENNVIFHGWAENSREVAKLINESRILISPSYNEGGPRVILEAMACGIPVLATPVGLVPDLGAAVVQTDWSSENIAEKTKIILDDQTKYMKLKQEGIEIVKQFERKSAIKNYAEKLKESAD